MALETKEIPALLFWVAVLGITVLIASKVVSQVSAKASEVFR